LADNRQSLCIFYARRFLRIFPVYYATIAITALVNIRPVRRTIWWHICYLSNFYQVVRHPVNSPVTHFWSLAVEEQFYLVWPCLMLFVPRRHLLKVIFATICVGPIWRLISLLLHVESGGNLMFGCLDTLGMGALLAYFRDQELGDRNLALRLDRVAFWIGLPTLILLLIGGALHFEPSVGLVLSDLALAFAFVWLVSRASSSISGPFGALLELRPVNYLGRISYGVYVLHAFTPVVLFYALKWFRVSWADTSLIRFLVLVAMSIAAAAVSWQLLESPINAYKHHFEYPPAVPSVAPSATV
jgi:peptidoglycan/LPS O-acetylase OafA/YrhL